MDFSHTAYFSAGQPFQFIGIPPLTPSHSNSATSEDFNTTSPPEVYGDFPNETAFQNFENYAAHYNAQQQQQQQQQNQTQQQPPPPTQQPQFPPTPPTAHGLQPSSSAAPALNGTTNGSLEAQAQTKAEPGFDLNGNSQKAGSNSDDEDMTPAQSRRKAQNRAAQRAFRERKERHVKDLEAKLADLEAAQAHTATENERLKRDLQKVSTENEILRATSSMATGSPNGGGAGAMTTGPMTFNPESFYTDLLAQHDNKTRSHRVATSESGERLLAAGATWDLIVGHDLYRRGLVDVADVSNRLKNQAKCDGQGPVFEEAAILRAIEASVGSGSDDLLI